MVEAIIFSLLEAITKWVVISKKTLMYQAVQKSVQWAIERGTINKDTHMEIEYFKKSQDLAQPHTFQLIKKNFFQGGHHQFRDTACEVCHHQ